MKNKKEIVISPTRVVTALIIFLVLVTVGFLFVPRITGMFADKPIGMTAEAAARAGSEAFFSVDAKSGKDAWISQVCKTSTDTGCKLAAKVYAPMLWPSIEKKALRYSCKAVSASKLQVAVANSANELWEIKTVCTNLDTGETSNSVTQAIVSSSVDAGWKFERILFDKEVKK